MEPLPIGYDNFRDLIDQRLTFVDKSLFIKEFLDDRGTQVTLITRPRRFGKSLNFSMLHHFFATEVLGKPTKDLFAGLKIMQQDPSYLQHQGKYPVIALSFKDVKDGGFDTAYANLKNLLSRTYGEHAYLLDSTKLRSEQKSNFEAVLTNKADEALIQSSLLSLCDCLYHHYDQKVILLLDEYDTPIQSGYMHGYYDKIVELIRNLFSACLKTNPYLSRAALTGILRVSKESLFSGLNNIKVYSVLNAKYSEHFGFTETEVNDLFTQANLNNDRAKIKEWYNGYQIGDTVLYNPWSIVNCIQEQGLVKPYWVNTSDNSLIKNLLVQSSTKFKHQFELLLEGKNVEQLIDENFVFPELRGNETAVWSLLLLTGYLKTISTEDIYQGSLCKLQIPNQEIKDLFRKIIEQWLANGKGIQWYNEFLNHLLTGNIKGFSDNLENLMLQTTSVHDLAHEPEAFYQGLMLGLVASLDKNVYEIKSNKESGLGRYDIIIIPKETHKLAIILELKSVKPVKNEDNLTALLKQEAELAIVQINKTVYDSEIKQRGITNILKIGLAFSGKQFQVAANRN